MITAKARPHELTALLASLDEVGPDALTACPGWTAHHLAAHIAGNYAEVRRHLNAFAAGEPLTTTRSWEEREAPLLALDHSVLLRRIQDEGTAAAIAAAEVVGDQPEATMAWSGRTVSAAGFLTHMRSEDALHRWDLVGDDDISRELLDQHELLVHAVTFVGAPLTRRGLRTMADRAAFTGRVRCPGRDDLVIDGHDGDAWLSIRAPDGKADLEGDPASRLLLLWGRKATPYFRLRTVSDEARAGRIQAVLAGY